MKMLVKKILFVISFGIASVSYAEDLNLYIGANYLAPATAASYAKIYHANINQSFFNDPEEMLAKMSAGASGYDVIVATSYAVEELAHMGKIEKLDKSKISNIKYLSPSFMNQSYDKGNVYSIPYAYNPVFLAYNKDKLDQLGIIPNTWAVIFDPKYLVKLKGRVTVFDSSRNVMAAALLYLGKDPNTTNHHDLEAARDVIEKASPYWAKFDSDSYYRGMVRGDIWLSMAYSIDIYKTLQDLQSIHSKVKIAAMLQKEGNMIELDNLVIPRSSKKLGLAYAFLNHSALPQSAYELAMATGSSITNLPALKMLSPAMINTPWIYPTDMNKVHVFKSYDPKTRVYVNEMWTELRMSCH